MFSFKKLLEENSHSSKIRKLKIKHTLATVALNSSINSSEPNRELHSCLSHLAEVSELNIDISMFEYLCLYPNSTKFDSDICVYCKTKLHELEVLISEEIAYSH